MAQSTHESANLATCVCWRAHFFVWILQVHGLELETGEREVGAMCAHSWVELLPCRVRVPGHRAEHERREHAVSAQTEAGGHRDTRSEVAAPM